MFIKYFMDIRHDNIFILIYIFHPNLDNNFRKYYIIIKI